MVKQTFTDNEIAIFRGSRDNDFANCFEQGGTLWFGVIDSSGLDPEIARGTTVSLVKKGVVNVVEAHEHKGISVFKYLNEEQMEIAKAALVAFEERENQMSKDTSINFNIVWQQTYQDKLREYLQRTGKSQTKLFTELLEDFLDSQIDTSFEGWYAYLIKEEGLQPEEAEKQAYTSHLANCFVPKVIMPSNKNGLYPWEKD